MTTLPSLTHETAMGLYSGCQSPMDWFDFFKNLNTATWCVEDLHMLAKACVYGMYSQSIFSLDYLKSMFLFHDALPSVVRSDVRLKVYLLADMHAIFYYNLSSAWCTG